MTDTEPDAGEMPEPDPAEKLLREHEAQLDELIADVEPPEDDATDDGVTLDLPGLTLGRRDLMKTGAAVGVATSLAGCSFGGTGGGNGNGNGASTTDHKVPPGEHDDYYGFWSGGHSGEVRVVGIPSMRELRRIPVFQKDGAVGYGHDEQTKEVLREGGDVGSVAGHEWGDTHHPILSESGGDYDGRYLWINDKVSGRLARINLKYFETDAITDIPNMQACHGCSVQSPDTKYVYGVGEFRVPVPNDGTTDPDDADSYWSVFAALDPESMEVVWQVRVSGNLDNADSDKEGNWAFATGYNKEEAFEIDGMTHDDRDNLKAFDIEAIEAALDAGEAEEINGVPVLDGRQDSPLTSGSDPIVHYIPTPKGPHGCDVEPSGTYVTASGKLSPTVTMVEIDKIKEVDDPEDAIVGQPRVGMGPLHTTWDGRGHGYTTLFIDSQIAKWDIEQAVEAEKGSEEPVVGTIDVHYNPGHLQAVEAETTDPAGDWLVTLNKLSKDRFISVGPIHPDNDQLIAIGEDAETETGGMELVADHPVHPEPHDCVFASRDKISPNNIWDREDYEGEKEYVTEDNSRVERTGDRSVEVYTSVKRSEYGLRDFTVKEGDEVTITVTNIESSRDIIHGLAIPQYAINLSIAPQDTRKVTFTADEPGIYWAYCTYFCSALHLEMRSRMIVEPRD
ncbi:nitrous-oxide reductase [Haloplanus aerogenes]|uniref:Nitrous-oxide reductase n=2 Tax=Haloplanus aerogenes TaxID=660522 RepID=A0A3G8QUV1_9EURY|nr:nitrous-oxide reductase [Haloplanus aerogenes]RMB11652.1 nitrous-oxide reductase [Haloplanus aerogenes]